MILDHSTNSITNHKVETGQSSNLCNLDCLIAVQIPHLGGLVTGGSENFSSILVEKEEQIINHTTAQQIAFAARQKRHHVINQVPYITPACIQHWTSVRLLGFGDSLSIVLHLPAPDLRSNNTAALNHVDF